MEFFSIVATAAIAGGGVIAAFRARRPTRFVMWLTAYLVLIEGLVQLGFVTSWQQLNLPVEWMVIIGFSTYSLGNAAVVIGRALKNRSPYAKWVVYLGSALLAVSMLLLLWAVHRAEMSLNLVCFIALALVVLVSMPVGVILSSRRHADS